MSNTQQITANTAQAPNLRTIYLPRALVMAFYKHAEGNTSSNIETLGIIAGSVLRGDEGEE